MADVRTRIQRNQNTYRLTVTGSAQRLVDSLTTTTVNVARQIAPRGQSFSDSRGRGERIRTSHRVDRATTSGNLTRGRIVNTAPHAIFVHNGTRGPIRPNSGWLGPWTTFAGPHVGVWVSKAVSGQAANPWLIDAYNRARQLLGQLEHVRPMTPPSSAIRSRTGHTPGASHQIGGPLL